MRRWKMFLGLLATCVLASAPGRVCAQEAEPHQTVVDNLGSPPGSEPSPAPDGQALAAAGERRPPSFDIGGEMVFNYIFSTDDDRYSGAGGRISFSRFGAGLTGEYDRIFFRAKYLWQGFGEYARFGYLGYRLSDAAEIQLGLTHQPFGVRPYLSHGFIFGLPYLVGMEDDADAGVKLLYRRGAWDIRLAGFKSDEYGGSRLARWAPDIVVADLDGDGVIEENMSEGNQVNARVAYRWQHADTAVSEIGISGRVGQLVEPEGSDSGYHWAAAVHLDGHYGPLGVRALAGRYEHRGASSTDDDIVAYGALGTLYALAASGTLAALNAAWSTPVSLGPIEQIEIYNDFSVVFKDLPGSNATIMNLTGLALIAGPAFAYLDIFVNRNHPYFGADPATGLAGGQSNAWATLAVWSIGFGF